MGHNYLLGQYVHSPNILDWYVHGQYVLGEYVHGQNILSRYIPWLKHPTFFFFFFFFFSTWSTAPPKSSAMGFSVVNFGKDFCQSGPLICLRPWCFCPSAHHCIQWESIVHPPPLPRVSSPPMYIVHGSLIWSNHSALVLTLTPHLGWNSLANNYAALLQTWQDQAESTPGESTSNLYSLSGIGCIERCQWDLCQVVWGTLFRLLRGSCPAADPTEVLQGCFCVVTLHFGCGWADACSTSWLRNFH